MKKILVIEDNRSIRESILQLLEAEGFNVIGAADGQVGTKVAQEYLPDLILCDVVMPGLDGYGVLANLRQHLDTSTIPFIFLTSMSAKESFRYGMQLGADDYLTKPCSPEELLGAITSRFEKQAAIITHSQKQLDNLRNSIALSLPHEFRTPLNGILGLTEVLIEDHEHIDRQEILEIAQGVHRSAERLYKLIQNFLLYAELETALRDSERIELLRSGRTHYPKVLIADIATQIARQMNREADLSLSLQNAMVQISDFNLKKIVEELVSNAFKFSKPGTPVSLMATVQNDGLYLYVSDKGRGMTPEQLANLGAYMQFERKFYEQQGSGLGLAIAKRMVEIHGGQLTIKSILGEETTIQVTFPSGPDYSSN
jgi:two-component system, sensor histidine kinase and response regulator